MKSASRARRLARKDARARRRGLKSPKPQPPAHHPCTCGGRYYTRRDAERLYIGHTPPVCDSVRAIDTECAAETYVHLQQRAAIARETPVHTVPWYPEMVCEMPGFVMGAVRELIVITTALGPRTVDVYADALREQMPWLPQDSIVRVLVIGEILGIIARIEVPAGTTRGHASADVN